MVFDYGEHGVWAQGSREQLGEVAESSETEAVEPVATEEIAPPTTEEVTSWGFRQDSFSSYRSGFEIRTQRLCRRVLMFHRFNYDGAIATTNGGTDSGAETSRGAKDWYLVRSTNFSYDQNPVATYLTGATQTGHRWNGETYDSKSYPPVEFGYDKPEVNHEIRVVEPESLENLPVGLDNAAYQFLDLDGEGISGILTQQGGGWFYKANRGEGRFGALQSVATQPSLAGARATQGASQQRFLDLAGNGQIDLVVLDRESPGFYERSHDEDWHSFRAFQDWPNVEWNDLNLRWVDLNGDGHADILLSEERVFVWHPSMAEEGFGPSTRVAKVWDEEKGPALVFADASQSVYLADMSGDGLNDIVRIRNGAVCYWPNLGYGRFGAKVTMDSPPYFDHPEMFDQGRIRLADIDGSGTTDIVYLGREGVQLWFNQAGNGWSKGETLQQFPRVDNLASVQVVDLLGQGTACLVWSSALPGQARQRMQYVDLMGGRKPHLLTETWNNLGAETRLHYAPSTKFYLADKRDGKPWITKLPFPVHVLEKTETFDRISGNRFASKYAYHHGYFDGEEREFRGFGCVEQWDTEEYETFAAEGKKSLGEEATNGEDETYHLPPVHTRTWFHTGVYVGRDRIFTLFSDEYYQGDSDAHLLSDTLLPEGLTLQEEREACRALRGQMLRQEVYSQDKSEKAEHPYTVTESSYTVRRVQPLLGERHGVFLVHGRESLAYHYERNPKDPRIAHQVTLEVDEFGNTLKALAVAYPRRRAQLPTATEPRLVKMRQTQERILATLTETKVIHRPGEETWYRLGLPWETCTYEVTGFEADTGNAKQPISLLRDLSDDVRLEELRTELDTAALKYEEKPTGGIQRRLIERVRMRYRGNAAAGELSPDALDWGEVESLALPYESYELAFTSGLLQQVYGGMGRPAGDGPLPELLQVADVNDLLEKEGRYWREDDLWWVSSGRQRFERGEFYAPRQSRDPFGQVAETTYDGYQLAVVQSRDPIGNEVTAEHDYWALQPWKMTDPNENQQRVTFDALGMVVATELWEGGDRLDDVLVELTEKQLDAFLSAPKAAARAWLGSATTRIVYDLDRYVRSRGKEPVYAATLARETHVNNPPADGVKIQVSLQYSDGFGRELQTKVQAEAGEAPLRDAVTGELLWVNGEVQRGPVEIRWVGTGRVVYNNKGKPVKQYEPFFSSTARYEREKALVEIGVSPVMHYDPLGRVMKTEMPNGTFSKVVFDGWAQQTWDENDTVKESAWYAKRMSLRGQNPQITDEDVRAARLAAEHADTQSVAHLDTLGRPFLTVANNGEQLGVKQRYDTWVALDIEGNALSVTDARGNEVMGYAYEIRAGEEEGEGEAYRIYLKSMDAGERWTLYNVAGNPIREWDSRGFEVVQLYDVLQRPTHMVVRERVGESGVLAERLVYGEGHTKAVERNLRGQLYRQYDGAGVVTNKVFDFKGNLLEGSRQLTNKPEHYRSRMNWFPTLEIPQDFTQQEGLVDSKAIQASAKTLLETKKYKSTTDYDALNRPVAMVSPDKSVTRPMYNEANLLEKMRVQVKGKGPVTAYVENIDYDAKGQRERIKYGNGVTTEYDYEPETFRLVRLRTTRGNGGRRLQDLAYTYDPVGNITRIEDGSQQDVYFDGQVVSPSASYEYDALYRLVSATGREHRGKASGEASRQTSGQGALKPHFDFDDLARRGVAHPQNGQAMRAYVQRYRYDAVGNILAMKHEADGNRWERAYDYATDSNRLLTTTLPQRLGTYKYDAHGNMTKMPHLEQMEWDFEDQLQATVRQRVAEGNGVPETTYYVYDAGGERVRKVTERASVEGKPTRLRERIYLGGYEIYQEYAGGGERKLLERETLHVMDDAQRIALVETKTLDKRERSSERNGVSDSVVRYQLGRVIN